MNSEQKTTTIEKLEVDTPIDPDLYRLAAKLCPANMSLDSFINDALHMGLEDSQDYHDKEELDSAENVEIARATGNTITLRKNVAKLTDELCPEGTNRNVWLNNFMEAALEYSQFRTLSRCA